MPRKPRIDFPGAWHHVMHRGARRAPVFRSDDDCLLFLGVLRDMVRLFRVEVHAYALMPNHYHLLVRSVHGNLSRAMRHLNAVYTQATNRVRRWDGPVFRGRFHSQPLRSENELPYVLAYIHLNPLRADLVTRLTADCWTSHLAYTGRERAPDWLTRELFLSLFGGGEELHDYVLDLHRGREPWPEQMALDTGFLSARDSTAPRRCVGPSASRSGTKSAVLAAVCRVTGASLTELKTAARGPRANPARRFAVIALVRDAMATQREAGKLLGMSTQQVANVVKRWTAKDEQQSRWRAEYNDLRSCDI